MSLATMGLVVLIAAAMVAIAIVINQASPWSTLPGRLLSFVGFVALPALVVLAGISQHVEQAKSTSFCVSCHTMRPYAESLMIDGEEFVPASHFQNKQIPRDRACYSCHTSYTMFGDLDDKVRGVKHVWHQIRGTTTNPIELYQSFQNRECLHCHDGARSFIECADHEGMLTDFRTEEISCLDCHDMYHEIDTIDQLPKWQEVPR